MAIHEACGSRTGGRRNRGDYCASADRQCHRASLNMVLPSAMLDEVPSEIVHTILAANAKKVLLPWNRARVKIVRTEDRTLDMLIAQSLSRIRIAVRATCQA